MAGFVGAGFCHHAILTANLISPTIQRNRAVLSCQTLGHVLLLLLSGSDSLVEDGGDVGMDGVLTVVDTVTSFVFFFGPI